jgi:hypothetical protein
VKLVKRELLAIVLGAVVVLSVAGWFVNNQINDLQKHVKEFQSQNSDLQDQVNQLQDQNNQLRTQVYYLQKLIAKELVVEITEFSSPTGWMPLGGMTGFIELDLEISNSGILDVDGLTLEMKMLGYEDFKNRTINLDVLHVGETTEIKDWFIYGWEEGIGHSYEATLKLGEVVLDVQYFHP